MKILFILPFIFCLFFNKKTDSRIENATSSSISQQVLNDGFRVPNNNDLINSKSIIVNDKQMLINDGIFIINDKLKSVNDENNDVLSKGKSLGNFKSFPNVAPSDCQKTIQFDLTSVTTVRKIPKPIWQQRQEGIVETTHGSTENESEFTERSELNICINATGDCQWKVSKIEGKSPVYSPLSIYVVSCLRQMSGDYGALPEKIVDDMRAAGSSVEGIGNQTIVVKTPRHPTNGQFGIMVMDTARCAFLGSSLYNNEDRLQFKVIYNYALNDTTGERILASATLITNDFDNQTTTETTTFFNKK